MGSVVGFFARSALMTSPAGGVLYAIGRFLKRIPWQVWVAILVGAVLTWHVIHEKRARAAAVAAAYDKGRTDERNEAEKLAATVTSDMAVVVNPIAEKKRAEHEENLRRISADAAAFRLRGAGKAECRDPAFSARPSEPERGGAAGGAALPKVPYPEWSALIAMPVSAAAGIAESHDALRSEVITWHGWYNDTYAAWEKQRIEAAKPKR